MPKYDEFLKELLRLAPEDFVRLAFPDQDIQHWKITLHPTEVQSLQKRMDSLILVEIPKGERFFLQVEFQGWWKKNFLHSLRTYRALIQEKEEIPIKSEVFFLESSSVIEEIPSQVQSQILGKEVERFEYGKWMVWDWKAREMLGRELDVLLPLIPLGKMEKGDEEAVLREALQRIKAIPEEERKRNFLLVFYIFAGYNYKEIVTQLVEEEKMKDLMESGTYRELFEKATREGMKEGMKEGELKKSREAVLRFLGARFGNVRDETGQKVKAIQNMEKLDSLIDLAATCKSLEEFETGI